MKLSELLINIDGVHWQPRSSDPEITSIHYRSQEVTPGGLFVAIVGHQADGHDYIEDAFERGAVAVVTQKPPPAGGLMIQADDSRAALADLAARFYRWPSENLKVIGITGTNGKTTTAYLVESILASAGFSTGVIGTIDYRYGGRSFDSPVTTPESLDLERILAEMADAGVTHAVVEVSSHAIALGRIRNLWLDVAVFTNLSQDHLDFHGDLESYWACKRSLFTEHLPRGPKSDRAVAVINCFNKHGEQLAAELRTAMVTVGTAESSHVRSVDAECGPEGIRCQLKTRRARFNLTSKLVGHHNVENLLCAVGVAEALELPAKAIETGIGKMPHVPGRLEPVENTGKRYVFVDYAHTPDALENVLQAIGAIATGRIICVFGCGGDRDRGKRPLMGAIAGRLSDLAIVTSDNPRTEDAGAIIAQIETGMQPLEIKKCRPEALSTDFESGSYVLEPDRKTAIGLAIGVARGGDTVLIAGKGHETYQILGNRTISFDDRQQARQALNALDLASGGRQ